MNTQRQTSIPQKPRTRKPNSVQQHEEGISTKLMPPRSNNPRPRMGRNNNLTPQQVGSIVDHRIASLKTVKYFELFSNITTVSSSGTVVDLSAIPQGVAQLDRVADTVFIQNADIRLSVVTANADIYNLVRIIFFTWKVDSALSAPTIADILAFTGSTPLVYANFNFENRQMYGVLKDIVFNMSGTSTNPTKNSQHYMEFRLPMSRRRIDYNLGSTSGTGKIYFAVMSDSAAVPYPVLNLNMRIWYMDD